MRSLSPLVWVSCFALAMAPSSAVFAQAQQPQAPQVRPIPQSQQQLPQVRAPLQAPRIDRARCDPNDCDGDGRRAEAVGGDDCDDMDGNRYPGNVEIADFDGHDEDCDLTTFGVRDVDGDGETDSRAYNSDGRRRFAGTDCNDQVRAINSMAQELPNGVDDDCNGDVDDLVGTWYTPTR